MELLGDLPKGDFADFLRRLLGGNALIASVFPGGRRSEGGLFYWATAMGWLTGSVVPVRQFDLRSGAVRSRSLGNSSETQGPSGAGREGGVLDSRRTRPAE